MQETVLGLLSVDGLSLFGTWALNNDCMLSFPFVLKFISCNHDSCFINIYIYFFFHCSENWFSVFGFRDSLSLSALCVMMYLCYIAKKNCSFILVTKLCVSAQVRWQFTFCNFQHIWRGIFFSAKFELLLRNSIIFNMFGVVSVFPYCCHVFSNQLITQITCKIFHLSIYRWKVCMCMDMHITLKNVRLKLLLKFLMNPSDAENTKLCHKQ